MHELEEIAERSIPPFEARTAARDRILYQARTLTPLRQCHPYAIHRDDNTGTRRPRPGRNPGRVVLNRLKSEYSWTFISAGYTQDALKEFTEASIVCAFADEPRSCLPRGSSVESATISRFSRNGGRAAPLLPDDLLHEHPAEAIRSAGAYG
jgi:predicted translin family RNA/ssDNA-binding protein